MIYVLREKNGNRWKAIEKNAQNKAVNSGAVERLIIAHAHL